MNLFQLAEGLHSYNGPHVIVLEIISLGEHLWSLDIE